MRCARDGKPARVAFGIGFRRIQQRNIQELAGSELELRRLFETKRHRALGNFFSITKFRDKLGPLGRRCTHSFLLNLWTSQCNMFLVRCSFSSAGGSMVRSYQRLKHPFVPLFCLQTNRHCSGLLHRPFVSRSLVEASNFFTNERGPVGRTLNVWFGCPSSGRSRSTPRSVHQIEFVRNPASRSTGYHY